MTLAAAGLTLWAVRRLTAPVRTLAAAAEALGRDVNAPPLPEDGPTEVATAAAAFNTMAARIRRFVQDRTELLTAIGHDLRTPITRLKLRAEFIEDDEQRGKMLADLEELEAMVSATLAFGRDAADDRAGGRRSTWPSCCAPCWTRPATRGPDAADALRYEGPPHLTVRARPLALKRALANLVANAVTYGGGARVRLTPPADGMRDRSRSRMTARASRRASWTACSSRSIAASQSATARPAASGSGLPIARNILRAHGGDVALANRPTGGVGATVTLPV